MMNYQKHGKILLAFLIAFVAFVMLGTTVAQAGEIPIQAAASDEFHLLPNGYENPTIAAIAERDRMYIAARPGFVFAQNPIRFDAEGRVWSGGWTLFDTFENAVEVFRWLAQDFKLDGIPLLARDIFDDFSAILWHVVGAYDFTEKLFEANEAVFREERWASPPDWSAAELDSFLEGQYHAIRNEARRRAYTKVYLLQSPEQNLVSVVYFNDRECSPCEPLTEPDQQSYDALAGDPTMGKVFERMGWTKIYDETKYVWMTWYPFEAGDSGKPSRYAAPFPGLFAGDGLCVPSQGENFLTTPQDCSPLCGDGVWDTGETNAFCPSDVPAF